MASHKSNNGISTQSTQNRGQQQTIMLQLKVLMNFESSWYQSIIFHIVLLIVAFIVASLSFRSQVLLPQKKASLHSSMRASVLTPLSVEPKKEFISKPVLKKQAQKRALPKPILKPKPKPVRKVNTQIAKNLLFQSAEQSLNTLKKIKQQKQGRSSSAVSLPSNSEINAYANMIQSLIQQNWIQPQNTQGLQATVNIQMDDQGRIVGAHLLKGSGNAVFDSSLMLSIQKTNQLPLAKQPNIRKLFKDVNIIFGQ